VIVISEGKDGQATGVLSGVFSWHSTVSPHRMACWSRGRHVGFGKGEILEGVAES
jgi:hypothetical protein